MSDFDLTKYLSSRVPSSGNSGYGPPSRAPVQLPELSPVSLPQLRGFAPVESKLERLLAESNARRELVSRQAEAKRNALEDQNKNSWATQLGLDWESNTGTLVNAAAGAISTGSRLAGNLVAAPFSIGTASLEESIDPRSMDILQRMSAGQQITPEEAQWIDAPTADMYDPNVLSGPSPRQMFEGTIGLKNIRPISRNINEFADISSIVDTRSVEKAREDLLNNAEYQGARDRLSQAGWSPSKWEAKDLQTLLTNMGRTALDNPQAAIQLIAENAPQVALSLMSPAAMVATNVGYANSYYDKWSDNFVAREGRQPTTEEKKEAQANSWSLAAAETIGDLTTAGAVRGLKGALGVGGKAVPAAVKEAATAASKGLVGGTVKAAGRVAGAGTKGALGEMPTEAYQTSTEELLEKGERASFDDTYFGGFAGALAGGGNAAIGRALVETADAGLAGAAKVVQKAAERQEIIDKGDISSFVGNTDATKNDWKRAANVLVGNANLDNKTGEDVALVADKLDKEVFVPLNDAIAKLKLKTTEGRQERYQNEINLLEQSLSEQTSPEVRKNVETTISRLKSALETPIDSKTENAAVKQIKVLEAELGEVQTAKQGLYSKLATTNEQDVISSVKSISEATTVDQTSADGLVKRVIAAPRAQTVPVAKALTELADSGKVNEKTAQAMKVLAKSIEATESLKTKEQVSSEVLGTAPKPTNPNQRPMKGVRQYLDEFTLALDNGFTGEARATYEKLKTFLDSRATKAEALREMQPNQVLQNVNGSWNVVPLTPQNRDIPGLFKTINSNKGALNTASTIDRDLTIAYPMLDGMALRLELPVQPRQNIPSQPADTAAAPSVGVAEAVGANAGEAGTVTSKSKTEPKNVQTAETSKTTEAKQTEEKRQEVSGTTATAATTETTTNAQPDVVEETSDQVFEELSAEELAAMFGSEIDSFIDEALTDLDNEEQANEKELSEVTEGRAEATTSQEADTANKQQVDAVTEIKEDGGVTEVSGSSSETAGTKTTPKTDSERIANENRLARLLERRDRVAKFLECLG